MASGLDFLFNGSPPTSVTTNQVSSTSTPDWYQAYQQGIANKATSIASQPYTPYPGQQVADFNDQQRQAFDLTSANVGNYQPYLDNASTLAKNSSGTNAANFGAANSAAMGSGADYGAAEALAKSSVGDYSQANDFALNAPANYGGVSVGGPGDFSASNALATGSIGDYTSANAAGQSAVGDYTDANAALAAAGNASTGGSAGTNIGTAQAWTDPGTFQKYMSPYTQSVVDEISRLGNQNLSENIVPGVQSQFVGSGQFGSARNATTLGNAVRDAQTNISGLQTNALESGYTTASNIFGADANRAADMAKTQGSLDIQSQGINTQAATAAAQIKAQMAAALGTNTTAQSNEALQYANMLGQNTTAKANQGQAAASTLGSNTAQAANEGLTAAQIASSNLTAAASQKLQAAGLLASNTTAAAGQGQNAAGIMANDATAGAQNRLGASQVLANTAGANATANSNLITQLMNMGGLQQSLGQGDVNNLLATGNQQQALEQKGDDTAYNNFLTQQGWDWSQLGNVENALKSTVPSTTTSATTNAPVAGTQSPSGLSILNALMGLYNSSAGQTAAPASGNANINGGGLSNQDILNAIGYSGS